MNISEIKSTQDRGEPAMVPEGAVESHGTGIRYEGGPGHRPKIRRTIRLPKTDVKVQIDLGIDVNGYPILFIDTDGIPIVENEVELLVYINNGTDPGHTRYTPLREVGR